MLLGFESRNPQIPETPNHHQSRLDIHPTNGKCLKKLPSLSIRD
jgi:hypothetical protein